MVTIERKGSENLAKSGATAVDQSNLGQAPRSNAEIILSPPVSPGPGCDER